jgi:hypothetical protein
VREKDPILLPLEVGAVARPDDDIIAYQHGHDLDPDKPAALIFVPSPPILSTKLTLESGLEKFDDDMQVIAITPAPADLRSTLDLFTDEPRPGRGITFGSALGEDKLDSATALFCSELERGGVDPSIVWLRGVTCGLLMMDDSPQAIVDILTDLRVGLRGIYPNVTAWNEAYIAEVADLLKKGGVDLHYPPASAVRLGVMKPDLNQVQAELGFRVPVERVCGKSGDREQDATAIMRSAAEVHSLTGKRTALKLVNGTGSSGMTLLDPTWPKDEQLRIIHKHLDVREQGDSPASTLQEFMNGVEVGGHFYVQDGKVCAIYTRKRMATGLTGLNREEVGHSYDPEDPIHQLCDQVITPKVARLLNALDVKNGPLNADIILDENYFGDNGQVLRTELPKGEDDTYIVELHIGRPGGVGLQKLFDKVFALKSSTRNEKLTPKRYMRERFGPRGKTFGGIALAASIGEPRAVGRLNALKKRPIAAASLEVTFADHAGYVLTPPRPHVVAAMPGVFYVSTVEQAGLGIETSLHEGEYISPIEDWETKGKRPVVGVHGENAARLEQRRREALYILSGLLLSQKGLVYFDANVGDYVELPVTERSGTGRLLRKKGYAMGAGGWQKSTP